MADKLDKMREKLEKIMYDIAVYMADERGLSYRVRVPISRNIF